MKDSQVVELRIWEDEREALEGWLLQRVRVIEAGLDEMTLFDKFIGQLVKKLQALG